MKRDTINYSVVGAFVLLMGAGFLVLMYAITGRSGPTDSYYTYYNNVGGVKFGTGVFYEGYRVGQVEAVEPEGAGAGLRYKLELSVIKGWGIPSDSVARIVAGGLISAMTIEITGGENGDLIEPGGVIPGEEPANLFAALNEAAGELQKLSRDGLKPLLDNINASIVRLTDEYVALRRDDLTPFIETLRKQTEDVVSRVQAVLNDANQERISSILTNVNGAATGLNTLVERIEETRVALHSTVDELDEVIVENRPDIKAAITDLRASLESLNTVLGSVESRIDTILYHVETSAQHASEFARGIRANPGSLLRGGGQQEEGVPP
jgi:phospholipid/cholesterol/gamma-HCH transport system substrate-binding protein